MKAIRILVYDGEEAWLEQTLKSSSCDYLKAEIKVPGKGLIKEVYRAVLKSKGEYDV